MLLVAYGQVCTRGAVGSRGDTHTSHALSLGIVETASAKILGVTGDGDPWSHV